MRTGCATGCSTSSATTTPGRRPSASSTRPATSRRGTRPPASSGNGAASSARRRTAPSRSTWATPATTSTACSTASCISPRIGRRIGALREAGIPEGMTYRPKWRIALELHDRAIGNGLHFDWMTFDEGYGASPTSCWAWRRGINDSSARSPEPRRLDQAAARRTRPFHRHGRGRGRKVPRLASGSPPARRVDELPDGRASGSALAAVADQGRGEGADRLGGQALHILPQGRRMGCRAGRCT